MQRGETDLPLDVGALADCVLNDARPLEVGKSGRAVTEVIFAAYENARAGRNVTLPITSPKGKAPMALWRPHRPSSEEAGQHG
jgi:hypothetical protein